MLLREAIWRTSRRSIIRANEACPIELGAATDRGNEELWDGLTIVECDDHARIRAAEKEPGNLCEDWLSDLHTERGYFGGKWQQPPFVVWPQSRLEW